MAGGPASGEHPISGQKRLAAELPEAPKLTSEPVGGKDRFSLGGIWWRPLFGHPAGVPIDRQLEHRLRVRYIPAPIPCLGQPGSELGLRPEAVDVPSGEADIVPESDGRHQQVDQLVRGDAATLDLPVDDPVASCDVTGSLAEQSNDGQGVPGTVGVP